MRRVAQIMGMPISVDIPGERTATAFDAVFDLFLNIDARFSPFKSQSELSRYQTGELAAEQLSNDMRQVKQACGRWEKQTGGYFSAQYNGRFDPTGYVKGWAIRRAGDLLEARGLHTYMINAGGDILAHSNSGRIWQIGLQHPSDKQAVMGTIRAATVAVATSGGYARGAHILDPHIRQPAAALLSVTVVGPDIIAADVLATAVFAAGEQGLALLERHPGYEALLISPDLHAQTTPGFGASMQSVR